MVKLGRLNAHKRILILILFFNVKELNWVFGSIVFLHDEAELIPSNEIAVNFVEVQILEGREPKRQLFAAAKETKLEFTNSADGIDPVKKLLLKSTLFNDCCVAASKRSIKEPENLLC